MLSSYIWPRVHDLASHTNCRDRSVGCIIWHTEYGVVGKGFNYHLDGTCDCDNTRSAEHAEIMALNTMDQPLDRSKLIAFVNHRPCDNCHKELSKVVSEVRYIFQ